VHAMEDPGLAEGHGCGVAWRIDAFTSCFSTDQAHLGVVDEGIEGAHGIAAAADTGDQGGGQATKPGQGLGADFVTDHPLEITHDGRVGMRAHDRTDHIISIVGPAGPFAHGLTGRVLERGRSGGHLVYGSAEQLHAIDIQGLALHVLGAHENGAFEAEKRGGGRGGDTVLAGSRFGDQALLAHAPGQKDLAEHIVDLMSTGMIEILTLEVDLGAQGLA